MPASPRDSEGVHMEGSVFHPYPTQKKTPPKKKTSPPKKKTPSPPKFMSRPRYSANHGEQNAEWKLYDDWAERDKKGGGKKKGKRTMRKRMHRRRRTMRV